MSSIGLCSKGIIFILWSELVLEGFQCVFEFVKSFSVTSNNGSKILNPTSGQNKKDLQTSFDDKRTSIQHSDCFFTRVLFFPDQDAISSLLSKDYGVIRQLVSAQTSPSSESEMKHSSHPSKATQNIGLVHHLKDPGPSGSVDWNERCWTRSTSNSLPENCEGDSSWSPLERGALQEMVLCLDGAVTSIDVCVLLLTCDRLTAPLLRAKARGVRVRVLLDRSMAAVDGSSLPLLRKNCIPVRLLPSDNNITNNAASQSTRHTNIGKPVAAFDGDAALHHKLKGNNAYYSGIGCNKSANTTASASSGLMHHKFAVIDAWRKTVQKTDNLGHVANENNVFVRNESGRKGALLQFAEGGGIGGTTTGTAGIKLSEEREHRTGPGHEGAAVVITGSFNWTWSAVTNNNENVIISSRPELVAPFSEQFEQLWQEAW